MSPNVPDESLAAPIDKTPAVVFPDLGAVTFEVSIFENTLRSGKQYVDRDIRNWGFFVYVRERLLNPEDEAGFVDLL